MCRRATGFVRRASPAAQTRVDSPPARLACRHACLRPELGSTPSRRCAVDETQEDGVAKAEADALPPAAPTAFACSSLMCRDTLSSDGGDAGDDEYRATAPRRKMARLLPESDGA